jgi:glycosyltransferase involved in cell wall biosynthesis
LHDVINVKSPQFFNSITFFHGWLGKRQAVRSFDHILTVSDASRKDAQEYLGADYNKMTVFPPGVSKVFNNTPSQATFSQVRSRIGQGDAPFILFVGTLEPRKNLVGLLHAFRLSGLTDDYRLVVVGAKGWKTREILQAVENLGLTKSVYFVGFVPDEELCALYRLAILLCYPSFDEGFCLPVLEAMACGCPVITSGVPAIKQVGGEVPVYVDPRNPRSIAAALKRVVADEVARKSMLRRGQERARRYSWEQAALKVSKVIESVIGS